MKGIFQRETPDVFNTLTQDDIKHSLQNARAYHKFLKLKNSDSHLKSSSNVSIRHRSLQERRAQHKRDKSVKEIDLCSNRSKEIEQDIPQMTKFFDSIGGSSRGTTQQILKEFWASNLRVKTEHK